MQQPFVATVESFGPITKAFEVRLDAPGFFGVVGHEGAGKSTILEAIQTAAWYSMPVRR